MEDLEDMVEDQRGSRARRDLQGVVDGFRVDVGRYVASAPHS